MKESYVKVAFLVAAFAVTGGLMSATWGADRDPALARAISELDGEWVGRSAPEFELSDLDGATHRLRDYRGEVIFLNFWASFCAPCRREMPSMERLIREYEDRGLEMLAITFDPNREDAQAFLQEFLPNERSHMTVLWDPESEVGERFGTELLPETYIIDRDGRVIARFVNAYDWTRPEVKRLVETLMSS